MSRTHYAIAALALTGSTLSYAQTSQPAAPVVQPQTPAKTKTTTTQSTSTTAPVPDEPGGVAVQKTTDTTTTTEPGTAAPDATSRTTQTTTTAPDATGAPTTTTTTTTTQPATDKTGATVTTATAADVKVGVPVFDQKGAVVGKIESVSGKGAVVTTGKARASVPVSSFGKNDKGLVISMTKAELETASSKTAETTPPKKKK